MSTALVKSEITAIAGFNRLGPEEQESVVRGYAKLERRQQRFVIEYLVDLNATEAAIRAGYSRKAAKEQGYRLFTKAHPILTPLLRAQRTELAEHSGITRERWLQEIQRLAFYDPRRFFDTHNNALDIPALDDDSAAAVAGFELTEEFTGKGAERVAVGYTKKFKLANKLQALELFGQATGYLTTEMDDEALAKLKHFSLTVNFVSASEARSTKVVNPPPKVQFVG